MAKRKATILWRTIDVLPVRQLALQDIEILPGYDRIILQAVDDEEFVIQILESNNYRVMQVLDPREATVEDFSETVD